MRRVLSLRGRREKEGQWWNATSAHSVFHRGLSSSSRKEGGSKNEPLLLGETRYIDKNLKVNGEQRNINI